MTGTYETYGAQADVRIADLAAQLAACQAGPPPPTGWAVGVSAGPSIAVQIGKWGHVPLRQFIGSGALPSIGLPYGGCTSFNPNPSQLLAGQLDATILAWAKAQVAGTTLAPWHELDVKRQAGVANLPTPAQQAQILAYLVKLLAPYPSITVRSIFGAHLLATTVGGLTLAQYLQQIPCDHLGFDFDGSRPAGLPYTDYTVNLAAFAGLVKSGVYKSISVPEFGVPQVHNDPTGSQLAAWLTTYAHALRSAGASALYLFDTAPEGPLTVGSLPFAAYAAIIKGG